jgi:hypothetical protein
VQRLHGRLDGPVSQAEPTYSYSESYPNRPGHYVYRLWDADGRCLYVGRVGETVPRRVSTRLSAHRREQSWWPDVARIDVAVLPGAEATWAEERAQIGQHDPVHNVCLRRRCRNGHDVTSPGARSEDGECLQCRRNPPPARRAAKARYDASPAGREAKRRYKATPAGRAVNREAVRRYKARRRYGPSPGQGALW